MTLLFIDLTVAFCLYDKKLCIFDILPLCHTCSDSISSLVYSHLAAHVNKDLGLWAGLDMTS